jgi:hypothetical protein
MAAQKLISKNVSLCFVLHDVDMLPVSCNFEYLSKTYQVFEISFYKKNLIVAQSKHFNPVLQLTLVKAEK